MGAWVVPGPFLLRLYRQKLNILVIVFFSNYSSDSCLYQIRAEKYSSEKIINRKEGNDQEPIQLPKTFRPRHQRERWTHLKQRHHKTLQAESQKDSFFPNNGQVTIQNINFTRTYMQRHTLTEMVSHSRSSKNLTAGKGVGAGLTSILGNHSPLP